MNLTRLSRNPHVMFALVIANAAALMIGALAGRYVTVGFALLGFVLSLHRLRTLARKADR